MNIYRIIISHNQSKYIHSFPKESLFVFDDIHSEDVNECVINSNRYITVSKIGNRGYNRNSGLSYILGNFNPKDDDIIEFFDGDRFPIKYDQIFVKYSFLYDKLDTLLYTCEVDERRKRIKIPDSNLKVVDTGTICNPFYSCGFAIKVDAIKEICKINNGMLFDTSFTKWGCEDQLIGILCDKLGMKVAITNEIILNGKVGGDSSNHFDYRDSLQQYIDKIRSLGIELRMIPKF